MHVPFSKPFTEDQLETLRVAMSWVIPDDEAPGAGTDRCVSHLIEVLGFKGADAVARYQVLVPRLTELDLADRSNLFAQEFIEDVKNVYYGFPDTGAWEDIGFLVQG